MSYTPGPWTTEQRPRRKINIHALTWGHLAEVYQTTSTKEEGLANARLIAAAPELYEALKAARENLHSGESAIPAANDVVEQIDAVLAKVTP